MSVNKTRGWEHTYEYLYQTGLDTTLTVPPFFTATSDANTSFGIVSGNHQFDITTAATTVGAQTKLETTNSLVIDNAGTAEITIWGWRHDVNGGVGTPAAPGPALTEYETGLYIVGPQIGVTLRHWPTTGTTQLVFKNNGNPTDIIDVDRVDIIGGTSPNANRVKTIGLRILGRDGIAEVLVDGSSHAFIKAPNWPTSAQVSDRTAKAGVYIKRAAGSTAHWMRMSKLRVRY